MHVPGSIPGFYNPAYRYGYPESTKKSALRYLPFTLCLLYYYEGAVAWTYGTSSQFYLRPIVLSNVQCSGIEERLIDCTELGGRICSHNEDAGVTCQVRTGMSMES